MWYASQTCQDGKMHLNPIRVTHSYSCSYVCWQSSSASCLHCDAKYACIDILCLAWLYKHIDGAYACVHLCMQAYTHTSTRLSKPWTFRAQSRFTEVICYINGAEPSEVLGLAGCAVSCGVPCGRKWWVPVYESWKGKKFSDWATRRVRTVLPAPTSKPEFLLQLGLL